MLRFAAIALVAVLGFSANPVRAEEGPGAEPGNRPAVEDGPEAGKEGARPHRRHAGEGKGEGRPGEKFRERIMHELFKGITLDDQQKEAIKKLHEENRANREAFAKEHKDELKAFGETMKKWHESHKAEFEAARKKMRDARDAKDQEAAKKAGQDVKALLESRPKMPAALKAGMFDPEKAQARIRAILHGDQIAKFDENVKELKEKRKKFEEGGFIGGPRGGKHEKCADCDKGNKDHRKHERKKEAKGK